ncbi:hypothetical protein FVA95_27140 [Pseudonocardia sp. EV170527-09]|uniref:hypothetical protein n=1 Tax=Pseudonocardia sp. EV170527-09 TaxID=2603411 RepID=UPI0011F30199|nr:hypothetical protein [Pseudonocardia sp. EV170527-09]KAA1012755.1 hypothetical protein FVA95_27140 [Pseudonocardia sp. EV170527-09]
MVLQQVPGLAVALVAGGFTILGVLLKIAYDAVIAGQEAKRAKLTWLAEDRRSAYEAFLDSVDRQRISNLALRALLKEAHAGRMEISDEEQATVPPSAMGDMVNSLGQIRRLARVYSVITSAEAIVRLFGDMASASRAALDQPGPNDEVTWFLLQRFTDERVDEFIHYYREDLGLGRPSGAPKRWPIVDLERPVPLAESEQILRSRIPRRKDDPGTQQ